MDWNKITYDEFNDAYNSYKPNAWIKFAYKYFSTETEVSNFKLKTYLIYILLSLFFVGYIGTIIKLSRIIIGTATMLYTIILALLVLYLFSAVILNNFRLKKVMKKLGVNKVEYNKLVKKYFG